MHTFKIDLTRSLTIDEMHSALQGDAKIELTSSTVEAIQKGRNWLDHFSTTNASPIYGINTGFGALYSVSISDNDLERLQENLVMSHACGVGAEVPDELVRLMLLLKIQALSYGNSGIQLSTVERLVAFFNADILPIIYEQGSLGASGDLAPLAHLSLPLIGLGEVRIKGVKQPTEKALKANGLHPIRLKSKEGLALLNGTQFMNAYGVWCVLRAKHLANAADMIGTLSLEAFDGRSEPFHASLHRIRPHAGQLESARRIRTFLEGSSFTTGEKKHVQDPYSFRCMPQVHGASRDAIQYASGIFQTEMNAVTDNPTVFPDENTIISGGNFHGQPLALALDFLSIAVAELGSISERRIYQLIHGLRDLPKFLVVNPGLNSGLMIPQYTAASIVSQNKQLCTPASVDSIPSSAGQEDHVSMGANAAIKCMQVVENVEQILAIELLNAAQAFEFRRPATTSPRLEKLIHDYRRHVSRSDVDHILRNDMLESLQFIRSYSFQA